MSGVFDADLKGKRTRKIARLEQVFQLSPRGMTFVSDTYLLEWMEVGVEMCLPLTGAQRQQSIGCRGVVVQCTRREADKGFEVALLFLDLPKRAQAQLVAQRTAVNPFTISISR